MDESDSEASDAESRGPDDYLAKEQQLADEAEKQQERERMVQLKGLFIDGDRIPKASKRKLDEEEPRRNVRQRAVKKESETRSRRDKPMKSRGSSVSSTMSDILSKNADPPGDLSHYQRIRVGRSNFAQVCFDPHFEDRIIGCFTRVCFSRDPSSGENIYRMTEIRGMGFS
jgi:RNA polymerase-associated protein RTF1